MAHPRRGGLRVRNVDFIAGKTLEHIDYTNIDLLRHFVSESFNILRRLVTSL